MSKRFACASSVETTSDGAALKKGAVEVLIQGHQANELQALLTRNDKFSSHGGTKSGKYCIPENVIEVSLRKGVLSKKKK